MNLNNKLGPRKKHENLVPKEVLLNSQVVNLGFRIVKVFIILVSLAFLTETKEMIFTFLSLGLFWRETNMGRSDSGISSQRLAGGFFYLSNYSMIYLHHNCMELDLLGGPLLELCIKCLLHQRLINMQEENRPRWRSQVSMLVLVHSTNQLYPVNNASLWLAEPT